MNIKLANCSYLLLSIIKLSPFFFFLEEGSLSSQLPLFPAPSLPEIPEKISPQTGGYSPMTAPKNPRVTITPEAHHALNIQAAIEQTTPGLLASRLILSYSKKAKQALQEREPPKEVRSPNTRAVVREVGTLPEREAPIKTEKRKRLFQNPQALEEIKRLWEGGEHNQAKIARQIGYNRGTVFDNIKRMIKEGTLSPLDQ